MGVYSKSLLRKTSESQETAKKRKILNDEFEASFEADARFGKLNLSLSSVNGEVMNMSAFRN